LRPFTFHISSYELVSLGTLFTGMTLTLLLLLTKKPGRSANLFLGLALVSIIFKTSGLTTLFLPALGPLLYFYVRQLTYTGQQFRRKDMLHFCSLLLGYWLPDWLILISVIVYLYLSHRLIERFYSRLHPVLMDRPRFAFRRLDGALLLIGLLCLLAIVSEAFCFVIALVLIVTAINAIVKSDGNLQLTMPITDRSDAKEKGRRLKEAIAAGRLYEDAELTLTTLAIKLNIHPHDLSRIINVGLEKNFSDLINEFRVREVARKMHDPAYDKFTLLHIGYESGFNSQRTFNRVFKGMTGKTPVEYKNSLKKELPIDKLAILSRRQPIILRSESSPIWAHEKLNRSYMLRNYLKIAWRNRAKNKAFTLINVLGLALGLTTCLLIVFYVFDELSYDRYNEKLERIYRINTDVGFGGNTHVNATSPPPLTAALKAAYPGVEEVARFRQRDDAMVKKGDQNIHEHSIIYADPSVFGVFTLPVISGGIAEFKEPHTLVITERTALKYFNTVQAAGRVLTFNDTSQYKIVAVIKNIPTQSHFNFDFFVSMADLPESKESLWLTNDFHNYVLLRNGVDAKKLESSLQPFFRKHAGAQLQSLLHLTFNGFEQGGNHFKLNLVPLKDIHLRSNVESELDANGSIQYVYILSAIAVFILLIACVNFMNLSTARSANRAREVGVRKVLGSSRKYLIIQFLAESLLVTFIAALIAVFAVCLLLPAFNQLSGKQLEITPQVVAWAVPVLLGIIVIAGGLAGSYPALYLSGFQPIQVLKGKIAAGFKSGMLRNSLVVFQFGISIFLIIGTLVIYNQITFIRNTDLGYNRDHVLIIRKTWTLGKSAQNFKNEVKQLPGVKNATLTGFVPTGTRNNSPIISKSPSYDQQSSILSQIWQVDEDYVNTLGMRIKEGRDFSKQMATDSSAVLLNETAAKQLDITQLNGQLVYTNQGDAKKPIKAYRVIGIIKDFNFRSLRANVTPMTLMLDNDNTMLSVHIHSADITAVMASIKNIWAKFSPNQQFGYSFMDDDFNAIYRQEQQSGKIFILFTSMAIVIACLGLFGLAAFAAEQRTKEIGIRKVLGATIPDIIAMLSTDLIKLVLVAILLASPLAWWAMNKWLQGFAYRQAIAWWVPAIAGATAVLVAFITVSSQAIKAARANPVKSLRSE
jgi:putative ABC transport system permease protein